MDFTQATVTEKGTVRMFYRDGASRLEVRVPSPARHLPTRAFWIAIHQDPDKGEQIPVSLASYLTGQTPEEWVRAATVAAALHRQKEGG